MSEELILTPPQLEQKITSNYHDMLMARTRVDEVDNERAKRGELTLVKLFEKRMNQHLEQYQDACIFAGQTLITGNAES